MKTIVVSVGTDHHPFDRMIDWIEAFTYDGEVQVLIQSGTSKASSRWRSQELIPHAELLQMFADADAVVCHGGPSTVMDARQAGKLPIVLPRNPEFGEHVDGHQMAFGEHLKKNHVARVIETQEDFHAVLTEALNSPHEFEVQKQDGSLPGVVRFGQIVDSLLDTNTPLTGQGSTVTQTQLEATEAGE